MKITKFSSFIGMNKDNMDSHLRSVDSDLSSLFLALQGRVRLGTGVDGARGENISGEFQVFTSSASVTANNVITHTLSATPIGWVVVKQSLAGALYNNNVTATNSTITLVSSITSTNYTIFLLK
jgi:hypothetical protein